MHLSRRLTVSQKARNIFGSKSGRREGASRDDGDEGVIYKVLIPERTMYFRRADLEPWPDPALKPQRGSKEWLSELARFTELGKQCLAKPQDIDLVKRWAESGEKIGFIVPIR